MLFAPPPGYSPAAMTHQANQILGQPGAQGLPGLRKPNWWEGQAPSLATPNSPYGQQQMAQALQGNVNQ